MFKETNPLSKNVATQLCNCVLMLICGQIDERSQLSEQELTTLDFLFLMLPSLRGGYFNHLFSNLCTILMAIKKEKARSG